MQKTLKGFNMFMWKYDILKYRKGHFPTYVDDHCGKKNDDFAEKGSEL